MPAIVLATLNARYTHASLGLRYLLANMGALKRDTHLAEFTIRRPPQEGQKPRPLHAKVRHEA